MEIQSSEIGNTVKRSESVANIFRAILASECDVDRDKEHFWVMGVNHALKLKYIELVSLGILDQTIAAPREIFRFAIMKAVHGIILCHNHPSGETRPSEQDIYTTRNLKEAGKILQINVYDHVILTENSHFSLGDAGLL